MTYTELFYVNFDEITGDFVHWCVFFITTRRHVGRCCRLVRRHRHISAASPPPRLPHHLLPSAASFAVWIYIGPCVVSAVGRNQTCLILPTVCPTGRTKRLHDTIVGPTSRTDQSDRPVGPSIVPCKRPVSQLFASTVFTFRASSGEAGRPPRPTIVVTQSSARPASSSDPPCAPTLSFGCVNIRSLLNRFDDVVELRRDRRIAVLCLVDTVGTTLTALLLVGYDVPFLTSSTGLCDAR